jgi:hypothetical protein
MKWAQNHKPTLMKEHNKITVQAKDHVTGTLAVDTLMPELQFLLFSASLGLGIMMAL